MTIHPMKALVSAAMLLLISSTNVRAQQRPLKVTATLSTFADLVKAIGGEEVEVATIASPKFNPHFIEPKPSDVVKVKRADLFVHAGLDLELWRLPLVEAAASREVMPGGARELDLSKGVALLEVPDQAPTRAEGDIHLYGNPHYWLDPENVRIMAKTITEKLIELDPAHAADYRRRLEQFTARLDQRMSEWRLRLAPYHDREVLGYHNEWPYLMRFADLSMRWHVEPKPGIPPTPRHLGFLEQYIKAQRIRVILQPTYQPTQASQRLAERTGASVVTACQNVGELSACSDYVAMMDDTIAKLAERLGG